MLDLSTFEKALSQVGKSLDFANSPAAKNDINLFQQFRAAAIQAFEYTYEQAIRFMNRALEEYYPAVAASLDVATFREVLRLLLEREMINNEKLWLEFREKRNITSHSYNENQAADVFSSIPAFYKEASYFLSRIKQLQEKKP